MNTQGQSGVTVTEEYSGTLIAQDHGNHPAVMQAAGFDGYNAALTDDKAATLGVNCGMSTGRNGVIQEKAPMSAGFSTEHSANARSIGYQEEVSPTLRAGTVPAALKKEEALPIENHPADSRVKICEDGKVQTLSGRMGTGGGNVPLVAEPEPITLKIRSGCEGGGKGPIQQVNKSATLGTHNDQTLFQPVPEPEGKAYSISKEAYDGGEKAAFNFTVSEERAPALQTRTPHAVAKPEIRAYGVCSKHSNSMMSDNPHSGFYEAETSRTLDNNGGNPTCNQGGICIVAPVEEQETYDVRFTSDGTRNARGHCYKTDISRCLDTSEANPDSNHGGIAVVALEPGAASRVGGHVYTDGKSGTLRANAGDNQQAVVAFTQNQRNEVRDLDGRSGALSAQPGMKQQTYVLQGSMIGRDDMNGPQGSGVNEDVSFTLNTTDRHAVAFADKSATLSANDGPKGPSSQQLGNPAENFVGEKPESPIYHSSKNSHHTKFTDEPVTETLVASDYKDPPTVSEEPMYIVRRLTPTECARLQGFPDWWCEGLAVPDPTDEELAFWTEVWETWRNATNPKGKPKTEKQIRKWLADPHTDAAEYKLWGNGCALPNVYFVLSGIAWAGTKADGE